MDNINITLQKNSEDGQTLCHTAEITGLDPADLLMAVCLNVIRKARVQANRSHATENTPTPAQAATTAAARPATPKIVSAGLFADIPRTAD